MSWHWAKNQCLEVADLRLIDLEGMPVEYPDKTHFSKTLDYLIETLSTPTMLSMSERYHGYLYTNAICPP